MRPNTHITVGTSFSASGYEQYGRNFIMSFLSYWDPTINLIVAHEGGTPDIKDTRVSYIKLDETPEFKLFCETTTAPVYQGRHKRACDPWTSKSYDAGYNFRFDAHKFGKKILGMYRAYMASPRGYFVWVDADVVTFNSVAASFIHTLFVPGKAVTRLYRSPNYHSECGFIGFDTREHAARMLLYTLHNAYVKHGFVNMREWHDSYIFDHLIDDLQVATYDLPHTSKGHPFVNSCLGAYMDHLKGDKRKARGRSFTEDYTIEKSR